VTIVTIIASNRKSILAGCAGLSLTGSHVCSHYLVGQATMVLSASIEWYSCRWRHNGGSLVRGH